MKITHEEYIKAQKIVDQYKQQLDVEFDKKVRLIKQDLKKYFSENLVCGCRINEFRLEARKYRSVDIIAIDPYFDEDYYDDSADMDIEEIGKRYDIQLGWESGVYPK